jgi:protein TonB
MILWLFIACATQADLGKPNPPPDWPLSNIQIPKTVHEKRPAPTLDNDGGAPDLPPPDAVPDVPPAPPAPPAPAEEPVPAP